MFSFLIFLVSIFVYFGTKKYVLLVHQKHYIIVVATSNNNTNNQAPVPSVCVRVPHSPSLDSGENSLPGSPVEKVQYDFATLVVREFVNPKIQKKTKLFLLFKLSA